MANMTFRKVSFTSDDPRSPERPTLYFDFVDPASYAVSRVIDRAGVAGMIAWRGFELRPPPQPMIDSGAAEWRARHVLAGSHASPPPIVPWTRKAHELCEFARERDCLHAVRRALFRAHFVDHTDIGRIDLLVEIAREAGLDRSEAKAVLDVDRYAGTVLTSRDQGLARGVADVPALVSADGRLEGPEDLREIERTIENLIATMQGSNREE